jgi:hypothetical protein
MDETVPLFLQSGQIVKNIVCGPLSYVFGRTTNRCSVPCSGRRFTPSNHPDRPLSVPILLVQYIVIGSELLVQEITCSEVGCASTHARAVPEM